LKKGMNEGEMEGFTNSSYSPGGLELKWQMPGLELVACRRSTIRPAAAASSTPASASKKRKAAAADIDDFDEEEDAELDAQGKIKPRMGESEIEAKRRQNTLAARRSRHRKLAYVRELEEKVVLLMRENENMHERLVRAGLE